MDALSIAKAITRAILATLVFAVIGFSLLLAPEIDTSQILFAFGKGFLTFAFGWIFILILTDTMVKSISASAMEAHAKRKDGGMLYHFLKPDPGEVVEGAPKSMVEKSKRKSRNAKCEVKAKGTESSRRIPPI